MTREEKVELDTWLNKNYDQIQVWSSNITKSDELTLDLAQYAVEQLLHYKRLRELIQQERVNEGSIKGWILATMRNSWYGSKSHFTRYYKLHRADVGKRKRWVTPEQFQALLEQQNQDEYDYYKDTAIEAIQDVLNEMDQDTTRLWYLSRLFKLWMETPNFSKLSRETGIPRTSIAKAIDECREYIQQQLKQRGIDHV